MDNVIDDWREDEIEDVEESRIRNRKSPTSRKGKVRSSSKTEAVVRTRFYDSSWTWHHLIVFLLTFFSYALFHAARKTFSNVKGTMINEWMVLNKTQKQENVSNETFSYEEWGSHHLFSSEDDAKNFMGMLDCTFLFAYATGLYISGILGDRLEPRLVLSVGMWLTSITVFLFGVLSEWLEIYSCYYYLVLWILSGFVQSSGWPTEVCIMGNWFGKGGRGWLFGIWSACASIGNIIGAVIAAHVLPYGYEYAFLVNASLLFAGGIVIFFGLVSAPREIGLPDAVEEIAKESSDQFSEIGDDSQTERPQAISICRAILLPGVIAYCLAYACLKLVNYSIFFWLPLYLQNNFGWSNAVADKLSTYYDWGGILGGLLGGIVTDFMTTRTPVVVSMLAISMGALYGYSKSPKDKLINAVLMSVAGFFTGGAANLISAAVSADLGRQPEVAGSAEALATVTGLVDGTGSVGAAIGQAVLPAIQEKINWMAVFYMFIFMTFCTILCLLPLLIKEMKSWSIFNRKNSKGWCYERLSTNDEDADRLIVDNVGDGRDIFRDVPAIREGDSALDNIV